MRRGSVIAALSLGPSAWAQSFYAGFELPHYAASAQGVPLGGQQGWIVPFQSATFGALTYANNAPGFPQNPVGGNQFIAGVTTPAAIPARAQHAVGFTNEIWTISYDVAARFNGVTPSALNLGVFSLAHNTLMAGTFQQFTTIINFNVPTNPALGWRSEFNVFNAAGIPFGPLVPGPFWQDLRTDHWYRQSVTIDFTQHRIVSVSIFDLHTGSGATASPAGWYLVGGPASTLPLPDAIRFFTGGNPGNITGWDNIHLSPGPPCALALAVGWLFVAARRRR